MSLVTEAELRSVGQNIAVRKYKSSASVLTEDAASSVAEHQIFDIFLSHSFKDAEVILGIRTLLTDYGATVYVDWINDPDLDRENVTVTTADRLRKRMRQSRSLVYAHSNSSPSSKWMSWELGYFDGFQRAVVVLPIAQTTGEDFRGQEFLGLYPYIDKTERTLWVNRGKVSRAAIGSLEKDYVTLRDWLRVRADTEI